MATTKQKLAIQKVVENHGNISAAMREVGYTEQTAKNPSNLTTSKAWAELMDKYLPDEKLINKIDQGLEATKTISATVVVKSDDPTVKDKQANSRTMDFIDVPDYATQHKFLETALKIKNKFPDKFAVGIESTDGENTVRVVFSRREE